jgi:hypothetical protein
MQLRVFGGFADHWRVWLETSWAGNYGNPQSDAFGAAYPYDRRLRPMEMYVERALPKAGRLTAIRIGRYREPFGIFSRSDHAYIGFSRAPLIRYGSYWALSNTFLASGVDVLVGRPSLSVESSVGVADDAGDYRRPKTLDVVVRGQAYFHSAIIGVSHLESSPSMQGPFVQGRMIFTGVDGRWMRGGVQLRGEWLDGKPFTGVATRGGYLDAIVHRTAMGHLTALLRVERLDYDAGPFSAYYRRTVLGARYQATRSIGGQVNWLHQPSGPPTGHRNALDVSATYTLRF